MSHSPRFIRSASSAALAVLTLAAVPCLPSAQAVTIQVPRDIGLAHAQAKPFNFTGRVFDIGNIGFGSGTLVRRHTVVTAGHVVFETATGFLTQGTFTRALYENYRLSTDQIISASALSGYQPDVISSGNNANQTAFRNDQGIVLLHDAPVDEDWANYSTSTSLLSGDPGHLFILGYPSSDGGFDGLTLAVITPTSSFTALGTDLNTGAYGNDTYQTISGMSGGPIFYSTTKDYVAGSTQYYVTATVVGDIDDPTGEVNQGFVRAINKESVKFIQDAEYTSGLISKVKINGPKTVSRGQTYTYTTNIKFKVPSETGAAATTDRYPELKIRSSTPGTKTQPLVTVKKTSNTTFSVTYSGTNLRAGTTTTLQVYYDKTATPLGKSFITVKIQ